MIQDTIICNICHNKVHYHPVSGADCVNLARRGPVGLEGNVLVEDDCWNAAPRMEIHICRTCEKALATFFKNRNPVQ